VVSTLTALQLGTEQCASADKVMRATPSLSVTSTHVLNLPVVSMLIAQLTGPEQCVDAELTMKEILLSSAT